ncbi:hypothetical protein COCMIDRAFT_88802 [Bipolaris oryzae ATCC 44560]|uniref:Secreted protein n=1 Tax=Bipolaris oryzae ATCC 44560 TaxID=930090 RepID=W6Z861_COCMI|nr:uncharacterized protein COCMIDRAFT_88802 [Bipolaris oryzae ATCC 44560]EUC47922.1 hypothetical protein COCMIDRAFT_88802 [Bipolaris oryzae ATCC 44560]
MGEEGRKKGRKSKSLFLFLLDLSPSALCCSAIPTSTTDIGLEIDKNLRHGTLNHLRTKKCFFMGLVGF